jgi:hypothetical protein
MLPLRARAINRAEPGRHLPRTSDAATADARADRTQEESTMLSPIRSLLLAAIAAAALPNAASATICGDRFDFARGKQLDVTGLTADNRLVRFRECSPKRIKGAVNVTGLTGADTALVGIDYRVQDGLLYGVGNGGGIYAFDGAPGVATLVSQLTVALSGTSFGVDFNPAADRLRVVSDNGQNLRHNLNDDTTTADGALKNGDVTAIGIVGAGYTNNDLDANTATTLFDLDSALDQISIQAPPNAVNLSATGKLGVDTGPIAGFDVYSRLEKNGAAGANWGFGLLDVAGTRGFYRIDLLTGRALSLGTPGTALVDIALPLDQ